MANSAAEAVETSVKKSKKPLLWGVLAMLLMGGGGFYAVYSGMILSPGKPSESTDSASHGDAPATVDSHSVSDTGHAQPESEAPADSPAADVSFIEIPKIIISLDENAGARHLQFSAQIEVAKGHEAETQHLMPRILDVLNGYLRAVDAQQLTDRSSLFRLRAQMLRRIKIVVGEQAVRDLLITEFVMN